MSNIPRIEINPSENQQVWDVVVETLYSKPEEFADILDWFSRCRDPEYRGPTDFIFYDLEDALILRIMKFAYSIYTTYFDSQERFVVRCVVV